MGTDDSQIFCLDGYEALAVAKMLFSLEVLNYDDIARTL